MNSCEDNVEDEFYVDPALEKIRDEGLISEQVNHEKLAKELWEEMADIHSAYLFHPKGVEARKKICICISSTPANSYYSSWKDLAGELGLSFGQICCIDNYDKDYTEMVLMTFCQKMDAALSRLVDAFLKIKRYDALSIASVTFPALAEFVRKDHEEKMDKSEYLSSPLQEEGKKRLLRPRGMRHFGYKLPITLQEAMSQRDQLPKKKQPIDIPSEKDFTEKFIRRIEHMQLVNDAPIEKPPQIRAPRYGKRVMLSFASDCLELAQTVAQEFRMKRQGLLPLKVLILDEHEDTVNLNPFEFIAHQFAKMDYIIPILSERYFECLCNGRDLCSMDYLDESYIKIIFDHMNVYYGANNCMNDKIRCIIPNRFKTNVINNKHFGIYPIFKVFTSDSPQDIKRLVIRLANAKRRPK